MQRLKSIPVFSSPRRLTSFTMYRAHCVRPNAITDAHKERPIRASLKSGEVSRREQAELVRRQVRNMFSRDERVCVSTDSNQRIRQDSRPRARFLRIFKDSARSRGTQHAANGAANVSRARNLPLNLHEGRGDLRAEVGRREGALAVSLGGEESKRFALETRFAGDVFARLFSGELAARERRAKRVLVEDHYCRSSGRSLRARREISKRDEISEGPSACDECDVGRYFFR